MQRVRSRTRLAEGEKQDKTCRRNQASLTSAELLCLYTDVHGIDKVSNFEINPKEYYIT